MVSEYLSEGIQFSRKSGRFSKAGVMTKRTSSAGACNQELRPEAPAMGESISAPKAI